MDVFKKIKGCSRLRCQYFFEAKGNMYHCTFSKEYFAFYSKNLFSRESILDYFFKIISNSFLTTFQIISLRISPNSLLDQYFFQYFLRNLSWLNSNASKKSQWISPRIIKELFAELLLSFFRNASAIFHSSKNVFRNFFWFSTGASQALLMDNFMDFRLNSFKMCSESL